MPKSNPRSSSSFSLSHTLSSCFHTHPKKHCAVEQCKHTVKIAPGTLSRGRVLCAKHQRELERGVRGVVEEWVAVQRGRDDFVEREMGRGIRRRGEYSIRLLLGKMKLA
jgi:hypothetical protein